MLRVIDLDLLAKYQSLDNATVFSISLGGERLALTAAELTEVMRVHLLARNPSLAGTTAAAGRGGGKKGAKAQSAGRGNSGGDSSLDSSGSEDGEADDGDEGASVQRQGSSAQDERAAVSPAEAASGEAQA